MNRIIVIALGVLAIAAGAFAQATTDPIEKALLAAPRNMKDGATVIKFKADGTYDTVKKGNNQIVCYDRSGEATYQPFAIQCTSMGNLARVAQNRKFEAIADRAERKKQIDAAEANGTRAKPEYGSIWYTMNGPDEEHARMHITVAVPGATTQSTGGIPDNPKAGGMWIMDAGTTTAHLMTPGH